MNKRYLSDQEMDILRNIHERSEVIRQRDIARIVGLSLGMTNAILKRLVTKGWLKIRRINSRRLQYIVTPEGMDVILQRSYRFLKRTIKNVVVYKDAISGLVSDASEKRMKRVILVGSSDLDFIVEHCCQKKGLTLERCESSELNERHPEGALVLYSEELPPDGQYRPADGVYLREMLIERR